MSAPKVVREAAGAEGVRIERLTPSTPDAQASPQRKSAKQDEKRD